MNLFAKPEKESSEAYWRRTEEKRGGKVGLRMVGTFLGESGTKAQRLSGLVYTVGESVWFEDFQTENWMAKIVSPGKTYEKTEFGFPLSDVEFFRMVSRGAAYDCVWGGVDPGKTNSMSTFARFFSAPVIQIGFKAGSSFFFEVMKPLEFFQFLQGKKE